MAQLETDLQPIFERTARADAETSGPPPADPRIPLLRIVDGSRGVYDPTGLVTALAGTLHDSQLAVDGFHLFTFNEIEKTEAWRQELAAQLQRSME